MHNPQKLANYGFFQILAIGGIWLLICLGVIGWYLSDIVQFIYRVCQSSWDVFVQHLTMSNHLILPMIILAVLARGLYLLGMRLWRTHRFTKTLLRQQIPNSNKLITLAQQAGISPQTIICIQSDVIRAFSVGIWAPKIWVSTGLLSLLDDDELIAVLQHEAHHCQKRDPLRLFITRLICDIFFFIPRLGSLSDYNHLAQEMAADEAAVNLLGDNLPLASALHKLLTCRQSPSTVPKLAISQLNITERRILALVSPQVNVGWQSTLANWSGSIILAIILFGVLFLTDPFIQQTITPCVLEASI